jgi:hypothetical protein
MCFSTCRKHDADAMDVDQEEGDESEEEIPLLRSGNHVLHHLRIANSEGK